MFGLYDNAYIQNILAPVKYVPKDKVQTRAHEQYTKALGDLRDLFRKELFNKFDGGISLKEAERMAQPKNFFVGFCRNFEITDLSEADGRKPKYLPEGKLFDKAGLMVSELFTRLEKKCKELDNCSKWLKSLGFSSKVNNKHLTYLSWLTFHLYFFSTLYQRLKKKHSLGPWQTT